MNFKKLATLLLAVTLLCTCVSLTASAAINFLPDFEADTLDGWNTGDIPDDPAVSFVTDPENVRDGKVLQINGSSDTASHGIWLNPEYQTGFIPGAQYKVSFWVNFATNASKDTLSVRFQTKKDGTFKTLYYLSAQPTGDDYFSASGASVSLYPKDPWEYVEAIFTMPEDVNEVEISARYQGNGNANDFVYIDDFKVMGTKAPKVEVETFENVAPAMTEWELSTSGAVLEENATILTVSEAGAYGKATVPVEGGETYVIEADAYASKDGDIRVSVDTQGVAGVDLTNKTTDPYFYNNAVDYAFVLGCKPYVYGHIKLTVFTADAASKLVIGLETTDGAVSYKNFSVKKTRELLSNGDFEALPVLGKEAIGGGNINDVPGWVFESDIADNTSFKYGTAADGYTNEGTHWNGTLVEISNCANSKENGTKNQVVFAHMFPIKPGKTYKFTGGARGDVIFNKTDTSAIDFAPTVYFLNGTFDTEPEFLAEKSWTWNGFTKYFTAPWGYEGSDETPGDMSLSIKLNGNGTKQNMTFLLDNLSLVEIETGAKFYNDEGKPLEELGTDGQDVHAYFDYHALEQGETGTLVLALYNIENDTPCLEDVVFKDFTAAEAGVITAYASIGVPAKDGYRVSAFCLDSLTGLSALENKYTIE